MSGPKCERIENRALGPTVHVLALVGLGNLIIIASGRGKPCELHVVLNWAPVETLPRSCGQRGSCGEFVTKILAVINQRHFQAIGPLVGQIDQCSKHLTLAYQRL